MIEARVMDLRRTILLMALSLGLGFPLLAVAMPAHAQMECTGQNCEPKPDGAADECTGENCDQAPVEKCTGENCALTEQSGQEQSNPGPEIETVK